VNVTLLIASGSKSRATIYATTPSPIMTGRNTFEVLILPNGLDLSDIYLILFWHKNSIIKIDLKIAAKI
jgi:hypothetical protein